MSVSAVGVMFSSLRALATVLFITLGSPAESARERDVPVPGETYEVLAGDTLERLGFYSGCTVWELQHRNRRKSAAIALGDRLMIPVCAGRKVGDAPTERPQPESPGAPRTYKVAGGDTWGAIAQMSGCSLETLSRFNSTPVRELRGGQVVRFPDCAGEVARRASEADAGLPRGTPGDLKTLMLGEGFTPPEKFHAVVTVIEFDGVGPDRTVVQATRYNYETSGDRVRGWNPASTIKLYSAIAALQRVEEAGFTYRASVEFRGRGGRHRTSVAALIEAALVDSDNIAHNRLVQLAGFERLNRDFFSPERGFARSSILAAYHRRRWMKMGETVSLAQTPPVVLRERGEVRKLTANHGDLKVACGGAACTSLRDLSEAMMRLVLGPQLPDGVGFSLSDAGRRWIVRQLRRERPRGEEVAGRMRDAFRAAGGGRVTTFHKPGYSQGWFSDVVYVYVRDRPRAYVVALSGYRGRDSLNKAAEVIGRMLAEDRLAQPVEAPAEGSKD